MVDTQNTSQARVQPGLVIENASPEISRHPYHPVVPFIIKPYLQLGDNDAPSIFGQLALAWHTKSFASDWSVKVKHQGDAEWSDMGTVESRKLKIEDIETHLRHTCLLTNLKAGEKFKYRIQWQKKTVFQAEARAPVAPDSKFRAAIVGDIADGGPDSRAIVNRLFLSDPDLTVIAGDIVYKRGLFDEYLEKFFPVFNCDDSDSECGAPFIRSYLVTAVVGNHDVSVPKTDRGKTLSKKGKRRPNLYAYELLWQHPENGPTRITRDMLKLDFEDRKFDPLFDEFGSAIVSKTNFSYSYGNSFWLHLDGNEYMDWTQPALRKWVCSQLSGAADQKWKFVVIHQPAFSSDVAYWSEQRNRMLCEIFEAYGVDIVFSGHCHIYERTFPLSFSPTPQPDGSFFTEEGMVDGRLRLDVGLGAGEAHGLREERRSLRPRGAFDSLWSRSSFCSRACKGDCSSLSGAFVSIFCEIRSVEIGQLTFADRRPAFGLRSFASALPR
mgnify:CR=1 FL=1